MSKQKTTDEMLDVVIDHMVKSISNLEESLGFLVHLKEHGEVSGEDIEVIKALYAELTKQGSRR